MFRGWRPSPPGCSSKAKGRAPDGRRRRPQQQRHHLGGKRICARGQGGITAPVAHRPAEAAKQGREGEGRRRPIAGGGRSGGRPPTPPGRERRASRRCGANCSATKLAAPRRQQRRSRRRRSAALHLEEWERHCCARLQAARRRKRKKKTIQLFFNEPSLFLASSPTLASHGTRVIAAHFALLLALPCPLPFARDYCCFPFSPPPEFLFMARHSPAASSAPPPVPPPHSGTSPPRLFHFSPPPAPAIKDTRFGGVPFSRRPSREIKRFLP